MEDCRLLACHGHESTNSVSALTQIFLLDTESFCLSDRATCFDLKLVHHQSVNLQEAL